MILSLDSAGHQLRMYWYFIRNGVPYPPYPFVAHANGRFSTVHPQFETLLHDRDTRSMCLQLGYANAPETIAPIELRYQLIRKAPNNIQYSAIDDSHLLPSFTTIGVYELFPSTPQVEEPAPIAWFIGNKTRLKHSLEPTSANDLKLTVQLYKAFDGEAAAGKAIMHRTPMENWRSTEQ